MDNHIDFGNSSSKDVKLIRISDLPPAEHLRGYRNYLQFILHLLKNKKPEDLRAGMVLYVSDFESIVYEFTFDMLKDKMLEEILNILGDYSADTLRNIIYGNHYISSSNKDYFTPIIQLIDELDDFKEFLKEF